jgi:hypothetical protein
VVIVGVAVQHYILNKIYKNNLISDGTKLFRQTKIREVAD